MRFRRQEIYYYNTESGFETEKFAGRLLMMILEGMQEKRKTEILFLCIGTDRSTGDSLGPLIGYKLKEKGMRNARVLGTLEEPVHAMNLEPCMEQLREKCPDALVVAVDASVGSADHVGYVTLGRGPLKPGLGVSKDLDAVGDLFITGIVGSVRNGDPLMLQSVRLSVVHASGRLHQPQHLPGHESSGKTCRKLFRTAGPVLTGFAKGPWYTST